MSRLLEALNGTLFFLLLFACAMFFVYMAREILQNGFHRTRLQAAISILVLIFFEAVTRGPTWWMHHLENAGSSIDWSGMQPTLLAGAVGEIVGIICVIRVFAPDSWGRNVWLVSSLMAIGIAAAFIKI